MHKRFMKLIVVVGIVAIAVALGLTKWPVVKSANASVLTRSDTNSSLLGYPRGVVGAAGLNTAESTPLTSLLGYPRGVVGAPGLETVKSTPAPHAQKLTFTSSYAAFPEVVRTMSLGNAAHATSSSSFDWNNVWIGIAAGVGVLATAGLFTVGIRRSKPTPATA